MLFNFLFYNFFRPIFGFMIDPLTAALIGGAAIAGGGAGYMGANAKNKKLKGLSAAFPKYEGYKPPPTTYLRPVETQVYETLSKRSKGEDVGYDPARREALLENFNITQDRDLEERERDLTNRLSGMGLSRNAAAYDDLIGRELRDAQREKNLYTNRVDVEDLARRNEERDINTARLQDLNTFNFGQENQRAAFDLDVFNAESGNERARRGYQVKEAELYEDPMGSGLESGFNSAMAVAGLSGKKAPTMSTGTTTSLPNPAGHTYSPYKGTKEDYMSQAIRQSLLGKGYNFQRG